ncbi:Peptidase S28 [Cinnamomum micranthum f. kanehirae]|uniref:Peptidase S28 n=1 Tax=Cinnamomum micranthum f. kanehirae TaxID=337451 RepID=A0A443P568_9MAGN|nr:Peptidase S28 [Cinnamomum micranthum f. kanehirae]
MKNLPLLLLLLLLVSNGVVESLRTQQLMTDSDAYLNTRREVVYPNPRSLLPNRTFLPLSHIIFGIDHRRFKQRYYEFLDHFRVPEGPIFLKICGESACTGIVNDYLGVLAKKFGAAVVSLEHRYYGKSSPFKSYTTKDLRYLSSKQALFDLATFRQYYQESLNTKLNRSKVENSWFVFGVSYPGALSAWFRLKFPHLTCGSLASSAVVLSVYNFTEFDKQVGESAGPECKAALQEVTALVDEQLVSNAKAVKNLFGAAKLKDDGDFLYLLADAAVTAFQYGNPDTLCSPLINAKKSGKNLVDEYASYIKDHYLGDSQEVIQTYDREHLKRTDISGSTVIVYGGSKFAPRWLIFRWHLQMIASVLQRLMQGKSSVSLALVVLYVLQMSKTRLQSRNCQQYFEKPGLTRLVSSTKAFNNFLIEFPLSI